MRLSSARRRLDTFLAQIDTLADSSFPHDDGEEALKAIRRYFEEQKLDLDLADDADPKIVDAVCQRISERVSHYTTVLGFILRSTNVRNAFETHYVLKRLIKRVFDNPTSLLISSEWAFVPFTYPMNLKLLPNFVFIGSPAPEAGNPLLIPLAGHEIGHSAWRIQSLAGTYRPIVTDAVAAQLESNQKAARQLLEFQPLRELDQPRLVNRCAEPALAQLEEIYCDLYGLHLFGGSFLYAFDYLLGPGSKYRSAKYPSDAQRMEILADAAPSIGVEVDARLIEHWSLNRMSAEEEALYEIIDTAVRTVVPRLRDELKEAFESRGIPPPDAKIIDGVRAAFALGKPYGEKAEIGEIVTAGWLHLLGTAPIEDDKKRREQERVLADLVLKTIEVAEYHDRIDEHATRQAGQAAAHA